MSIDIQNYVKEKEYNYIDVDVKLRTKTVNDIKISHDDGCKVYITCANAKKLKTELSYIILFNKFYIALNDNLDLLSGNVYNNSKNYDIIKNNNLIIKNFIDSTNDTILKKFLEEYNTLFIKNNYDIARGELLDIRRIIEIKFKIKDNYSKYIHIIKENNKEINILNATIKVLVKSDIVKKIRYNGYISDINIQNKTFNISKISKIKINSNILSIKFDKLCIINETTQKQDNTCNPNDSSNTCTCY